MLEINSSSEIKLSGTDIYFDSKRAVPLSFVSSANVGRLPRSEKIIATPQTVKLLGKKIKGSAVLSSPYGKPFTLGSYSIELIPSGQMLGGAQLVVEKDGREGRVRRVASSLGTPPRRATRNSEDATR